MVEVVGTKKHKSTKNMEIFPGFYKIYSRTFLKIMRTTDLQKSTQKEGKDFYDITITDCLWYNACKEFGCPELCPAFCDVDDITYGNLRKLGFTRTQTLGKGGDCCDFHFYRKWCDNITIWNFTKQVTCQARRLCCFREHAWTIRWISRLS